MNFDQMNEEPTSKIVAVKLSKFLMESK